MFFSSFILPAILGATATAISAGVSASNNRSQRELQQDSLDLQKEQFEYQKNYDKWSQDLSERNFQLQSHPVSSLVSDAYSAGVNPMAAMGQSVGNASASSSNVNTSFGASPVSDSLTPALFSMLTQLSTTQMNNKTSEKIASENNDIRRQELDIIEEKNQLDYELGSEGNQIKSRLASVEESNLARLSAKDVHEMAMDDKRYILDKVDKAFYRTLAKKEYSFDKIKWQKDFNQAVKEFEKQYSQKTRELNDKLKMAGDYNRMRYVMGFTHEINSLIKTFFAPFGGSDITLEDHAPIGFQPR